MVDAEYSTSNVKSFIETNNEALDFSNIEPSIEKMPQIENLLY